MKTSILMLLTVFFVAKESLGFIMTCPELDDDSESCDENMAWMCQHITWRNKLAYWKRQVEKSCFLGAAEEYWQFAFKCPNFSEIKCVDDYFLRTEYDLFHCPITFCIDGKYQDVKMLRRIWRAHMNAYNKLLNIYVSKLGACRDCLNMASTTTGIPEPVLVELQLLDTSILSQIQLHIHENFTTGIPSEKCEKSVSAMSIHSGPMYDGCKYSQSGGCYWAEIRDPWSVTYSEAESICAAHDSVLAVIPNEETYHIIVHGVKQSTSYAAMWLGMTINPATKQVCPLGSFDKYWYSTAPYHDSMDTKIAVIASTSNVSYEGLVFEGLINYIPIKGLHGAICRKPSSIEASTSAHVGDHESSTASEDVVTTTDAKMECHESITPQQIHSGPLNDECKTSPSGGCFWIHVAEEKWSVRYNEAKNICASHDSVMAIIPDEGIYHTIVDGIKKQINETDLWLGMTINPETKQVCPFGSFAKYWWSTAPYSYATETKISVRTSNHNHLTVGMVFEGLFNSSPNSGTSGVVCWKPAVTGFTASYVTMTSTSSTISTSTVTPECNDAIMNDALHSGPIYDKCRTNLSGGCFWAEIREPWSVSYDEAKSICAAYNSVLAVIPDENTYNIIAAGIDELTSDAALWLGMTIDPSTKQICPLGAFDAYWYKVAPYSGVMDTKIALISSTSDYVYNSDGRLFYGLVNYNPKYKNTYGAVCWKPKMPASSGNCSRKVTNDTINRGPVSENCATNSSGGCFWYYLREDRSVDYFEAERICQTNDSVLAVIPDEETYHLLTDTIGSITSITVYLWLGTTINPETKELCPSGSFNKYWFSTGPYAGSSRTKVALTVNRFQSYDLAAGETIFEGLINSDPTDLSDGVICWKPKA